MITIRPSAAQELSRLLQRQAQQPSPQVYLTLDPGTCGQWVYSLGAEPLPHQNTTAIDCGQGLTLVIDNQALELVSGLTIDYAEDLMGGGFRFTNPQAKHTCGCGHSFSTTPAPSGTLDCTQLADGHPADLPGV